MAEIDLLAEAATKVRARAGIADDKNEISSQAFMDIVHDDQSTYEEQRIAMWMQRGGRHVFLQDADSLVIPPHRVVKILRHLYRRFPAIDRVTT